MFSISTPICSSPRPATSKASPPGVSLTRIATFDSASRISRSRMTRLCTLSPSRPASGRVVDAEGDADRRRVDRLRRQRRGDREVGEGVGDGRLGHAGEADDVAGLGASRSAVRARPRKARIFETRKRSISRAVAGERLQRSGRCGRVPLSMRPVSSRPRKGSAASVVASIAKGSPVRASCAGGGTWSRISR